jgi:RNA polymerase sigma factor (TIGR02999 family)
MQTGATGSEGVTRLLLAWSGGDRSALDRLTPLVHSELRRIAAAYLRRERPGHTLQPTALVHEAYLRLVDQTQIQSRNRAQFFAIAANLMRQILVNHARRRRAAKRGGGNRLTLDENLLAGGEPQLDILALDTALNKLAELDPRSGQIVEMRFFGGLTEDEVADLLGVAPITVKRDWLQGTQRRGRRLRLGEAGMTAEQWQRVKNILQDAVERDPGTRAGFLEEACSGDAEVRREVESLLAYDERMGAFMAEPVHEISAEALSDSPDPVAGRRIGHYQLVSEIGHGGMGSVYLAERADGAYRGRVAIKLIQPGLGAPNLVRRFRNETQVLAALEHPNIARLFDAGATDDGLPYLVMEFVDGVPVDEWCEAHRSSAAERVRLIRQVCGAVQYAHDRHVIHRDLKPANILVTPDGTPKLLDFGIAKALDPELNAQTIETTFGFGVMTPEYASPEQARGEPVGPASDEYSLGVVLFRLLTGRPPYEVPTRNPSEIVRIICESEVAKPSSAVGDEARCTWNADLDNIVLKALRKDPRRRYASVHDFSEDLGRFLDKAPVAARPDSFSYRLAKFVQGRRTAIASAIAGAALVLALIGGLGRIRTKTDFRSIAVLPIENLSGDREQEYFADGITDALTSELSQIHGLRVISKSSAMAFKSKHLPPPEIGRRLGVGVIAEGSVLRSGDRIRIAMRLVDAAKDRQLWSGAYEGGMNEVFSFESQLAGAIRSEIDATLKAPDQARAGRRRPLNLAAYDAYLKGRDQFSHAFTLESMQSAVSLYQKALAADPGYAPAYAGLADCYYGMSNIYYPPVEVMPKAKAAALKAIELDGALGEAHAALALVRYLYDFDRAGAEQSFRRALELRPSDAQTHLWYGLHLAGLRRFDAAYAEVERARILDPVSPGMNAYVGLCLYFARRYDEAIQRLRPLADADPGYHHPHALMALSFEQKRDYPKAIAEMETAYKLDQEPEALAQLGHMYAVAGRTADARRVLRELAEISRKRYVSAYQFAVLHAGLGEIDEAFRRLGDVERDRSEWFASVDVDPRLDALHSDPRFAAVLRSVGLPYR